MQLRPKQSHLKYTLPTPYLSMPNFFDIPLSLCNNCTYNKTVLVLDRSFSAKWLGLAAQWRNSRAQWRHMVRRFRFILEPSLTLTSQPLGTLRMAYRWKEVHAILLGCLVFASQTAQRQPPRSYAAFQADSKPAPSAQTELSDKSDTFILVGAGDIASCLSLAGAVATAKLVGQIKTFRDSGQGSCQNAHASAE